MLHFNHRKKRLPHRLLMLNCYYPLLNDATTTVMVGKGASGIHFRIGIIGRITAWLCPALQESITFPVAVSSAGVSIVQC